MSERSVAIVDASVIYATLDAGDRSYARCVSFLRANRLQSVIPTLVLTEVLHFVGQRLDWSVESRFVASLANQRIEHPTSQDWARIAELVEVYRDFPLGAVDASVIALAERLGIDTILTLDRRHFSVVRPRHVPAFRILPD